MASTYTINLTKPIKSAQILNDYDDARRLMLDTRKESSIEDQESSIKAEFAQACQTLNSIVNKLNQLYNETLAEHREEITKLSVQIANKVLMQKVQKGDYQIESIINEVLKNAPVSQDVVVHLNPDDLANLTKNSNLSRAESRELKTQSSFEGIKLVADPNIGRAECLLETPKGIIKSFLNEHIKRISEALEKMENPIPDT
jgi:flagellar biosynthesis/type III secretory pathway protein FliH